MTLTTLAGLALVFVTAALLIALSLWRRKSPPQFREIAAFTRLRRAVGLSVEDGTRLHVSLGRGGLLEAGGAPALAGLGLLRHLAEQTSLSDRPPLTTCGEALLAILAQDTQRAGFRAAGAEDAYDSTMGRLTGLTPFSYVAGALPPMRDESVSANVLIGHFAAEAALLTDTAERGNTTTVAGAGEPATQAIFLATAGDALIGEELFAAAAYAGAGPAHTASLQVEDLLRWLLILFLLAGAALKLLGMV